jgi:[ribosomal protein S5]-alanine N-acetyltransferase
MPVIRTERLVLIPATVALLEAELESPEKLSQFLDACVPAGWPPGEYDKPAIEFFRECLVVRPDAAGWYSWYVVLQPSQGGVATVIGAGGYFGPPSDGVVEIGYSVLSDFQRCGYATELVRGLTARAFSFPTVARIIAHTRVGNNASIKVLERCGFIYDGSGEEVETVRYSLNRAIDPVI